MKLMKDRYLERVGIRLDERSPSMGLLSELQLAHLISVPFENLDVFHGRGVSTDVESSLSKIVDRRRGGWCFELNGAFGWLLREIGFEVDYVSCRVFNDGDWGPPLDHCALVVHLDGQRIFVDVGFGDCCMVPVLIEDGIHEGVPRSIRCKLSGGGFDLSDLQPDGSWANQLRVSFEPVSLANFDLRSDYLQTAPELSWSSKPFATRATLADGSRITIRPGVLRRRVGVSDFVDSPVEADRWSALLYGNFGLNDSAVR